MNRRFDLIAQGFSFDPTTGPGSLSGSQLRGRKMIRSNFGEVTFLMTSRHRWRVRNCHFSVIPLLNFDKGNVGHLSLARRGGLTSILAISDGNADLYGCGKSVPEIFRGLLKYSRITRRDRALDTQEMNRAPLGQQKCLVLRGGTCQRRIQNIAALHLPRKRVIAGMDGSCCQYGSQN